MRKYDDIELPRKFAKAAESFFRTSFGDVRLHLGSEASALCRDRGVSALTINSSIFVDTTKCNIFSMPGHTVLIHELAHVVQKKISGQKYKNAQAIELEASVAALAFHAGLSCPPLSADDPSLPRAWGPE